MAEEASVPPAPIPMRRPARSSPDDGPSAEQSPRGSADLHRLLAVAVLTPGQAVYVGAQVLSAASTFDGSPPGSRGARVVVTEDGDVGVLEAESPQPTATLAGVLDQVVRNAQRLPAHPRPNQVALLARLEEIAGSSQEPATRAEALHQALRQELGADGAMRMAQELAALVAVLDQVAVEPTAPRSLVPVSDEPPHHLALASQRVVPTPVTSGTSKPSRSGGRAGTARALIPRRPSGPVVWAALLALGLVLALAGYLAFGQPESGAPGSPDNDRSPSGSPTTNHNDANAKTTTRAAVPTLAPRTAGPVRKVSLRTMSACGPGDLCPVRVTVDVTPAGLSRAIGWQVGAVRLCTHQLTWSPITSVTAQPGWTHVYANTTVRIPAGHPVALVAVTRTPARAQSPPDRLAGPAPHC